ncbi:MAG: phBC6A51 family helix-turn-helix protein [Bacillota bacterium]
MKTIRVYREDDNDLSPEMLYVADILATPGRNGMKLEEIGDAVGVSPRTISRWRSSPAFARHVQARTVQIVGERLPEIMNVVANRAEEGSAKHAELVFKALGLLKDHHVLTAQPSIDEERTNQNIERTIRELEEQLRYIEED